MGGGGVQAFGPEGLGIIRVAGVPNVELLRRRLLPLAQQFAVRRASTTPPPPCACARLGAHAPQGQVHISKTACGQERHHRCAPFTFPGGQADLHAW